MKYYDKNGNEIKKGMLLRIEDGSIEKVYATTDASGISDLGINASNEAFLAKHPESEREYYSLSVFQTKKAKIIN